ncbi:unnamed protein product [Lactuca virosa]|uniref:Uncharacterized protein n=1 Tax=Lactuca virosa TaxID=75947 RepID=A0AAU9NV74_9ASTR|nr:unnamed protein product [Lactuca virosa]
MATFLQGLWLIPRYATQLNLTSTSAAMLLFRYQRCTRSVSIAVYYAHLAAIHARCYMEGGELSDSDRVAEVHLVPMIHENVKSVMYYC